MAAFLTSRGHRVVLDAGTAQHAPLPGHVTATPAEFAADTDLDVAIDMMVGAITFRVLQPNPPDVDEMRRYLREVYRQTGLLPAG